MITNSLDRIGNAIVTLNQVGWIDIVSLLLSGVSLVLAILVPNRIARKQDQIALFERRLSAYCELLKVTKYTEWLLSYEIQDATILPEFADATIRNTILRNFAAHFGLETPERPFSAFFIDKAAPTIRGSFLSAYALHFLYSAQLDEKRVAFCNELEHIYLTLINFIESVCNNAPLTQMLQLRHDLISKVNQFREYYDNLLQRLIVM